MRTKSQVSVYSLSQDTFCAVEASDLELGKIVWALHPKSGDLGSSADLIEECLPHIQRSPSKRISPAKRKQYYINQAVRNSDRIQKSRGRKSLRRLENTRYLMNLDEKDEGQKDDNDSVDPASPTIFTEAITNNSYTKVWNDFLNRSGEEQDKLIRCLDEESCKKHKGKFSSKFEDRREEHPAYTSKDFFQKIDRRLRTTLKRRQIPLGMLEILEEDLLSVFSVKPDSVYTTLLDNSYERLLLHALCQYMDLLSASFNSNGKRQTEVTNKHEYFLTPEPLLSTYLEQNR
ncbi:R3H domain-containing protein 4 [Protopterus annectens]|uniref:R3H domain-containing protein 4 n=1 Tax=Protopterus annectens TaxID=7888 RepID=UPI001CFB263B|nr:R3H domain-containing protein 4 [Protopterus annectens]